jgi:hypothetical protein
VRTLETEKYKPTIGYIVLGAMIVLLVALVNRWYVLIDKTTLYHDYWTIFWEASNKYGLEFWLGTVSILGKGSFGSAAFLRYVPWIFIGFIIIYICQLLWTHYTGKSLNRPIIWANSLFLVYGLVMIFIATGLAAMGHYLDLYSIRLTCPDGTVISIAGTVDWLTHWFTPDYFSIPLCMINFYDLLKWRGKRGRLYEAALVLMASLCIMLAWEIGESGNPTVYRNLFWDSAKDIYQGILSTVFNLLVYNTIVPFEIEEH